MEGTAESSVPPPVSMDRDQVWAEICGVAAMMQTATYAAKSPCQRAPNKLTVPTRRPTSNVDSMMLLRARRTGPAPQIARPVRGVTLVAMATRWERRGRRNSTGEIADVQVR